MSASARSSASLKRVRSDAENSGNTPAKKSNAERITERIFPSKEEMDAQRTKDQSLARCERHLERKQFEMNFTKAASELAAVNLRADTEKINLQKAQAELPKAEVEAEQAKAHSQALTRAKMIQDFLRAGVSLADAIATTTQLLEMPK
ncbi:hypothetical protein MJO29_009887 [Puccinia striiformis f. sp. tritici]|nr:hypothetical protein MJO29_009887 [Puccinia striiformis f. sp. tritici]